MSLRLTAGGRLAEELRRVVEEYNAKRGGEARAEIIAVKGDRIYVKVTGHFCFTCGVNEWVKDVEYMLEEAGYRVELERIIEPEDPEEPWRIGVFRILGRRDDKTSPEDIGGGGTRG